MTHPKTVARLLQTMATSETNENDDSTDEKVFEIEVEQVTSETVTVQAGSRQEAFDALEHPTDREVEETLTRKDFSSLSERRPVHGRRAEELEGNDPDLDIDLTE